MSNPEVPLNRTAPINLRNFIAVNFSYNLLSLQVVCRVIQYSVKTLNQFNGNFFGLT